MKSIPQKESKFTSKFLPGFVFVISQIIIVSFYPNWFTTNENTIDPWIYWGAGDSPKLSYSNDFAQTYYLQRYAVIFPQIVFQSFLGPYFGTLGVAVFWSLLIFCFIWKLCKLIGNWQLGVFVFLVFISDRMLLGVIGMSYTMASSIALGLGFIYFALQIVLQQKNTTKNSFTRKSFIAGIYLGLLANAYLTHALILSLAALMTFVYSKPHWRQFKQLLTWCTSGFFIISLFFQLIYRVISDDNRLMILNQLGLGLGVATKLNPWGGGGFFDFWTRAIFDPVVFYWIAIVLMFILSFFFSLNHLKAPNRTVVSSLSAFAIAIIFVYFLQTFFYANPIGYSWAASSLYLVEVISLIIIGISIQQYWEKQPIQLIGFFVFVFVLANSRLSISAEVVLKYSTGIFLCLVFLLILFLIIKNAVSFDSDILLALRLILFGTVFLVYCLLRNSDTYGASEGGMQDSNPKKYYEKVSNQRKILLELSNSGPAKVRIWLTPSNDVPVVSSQLYSYSLISRTQFKPDCDQVSWANGSKSIVVSFNESEDLEDIANSYIRPCGSELLTLKVSSELQNKLNSQGVTVGYLK
jgi:hypothetical protein